MKTDKTNPNLSSGYESNRTHPLLASLDVIETVLYYHGQETKGDPDPATFAELERWTPDELSVTQEDIDKSGVMLFEAAELVGRALKLLDKDMPREEFQEVGA